MPKEYSDAEIEQAILDAERYRYIKAKHYKDTASDQYQGYRLWFAIYDPSRRGLDYVIDEARKK